MKRRNEKWLREKELRRLKERYEQLRTDSYDVEYVELEKPRFAGWDYGVQGNYNLICEGHLHSIIQKLNINQRDGYQTIKDDAVDHRRFNCPSFFTGNFYSESLGYTSESGFVITEDNGRGVPNVFYYAV